MHQKFEALLQEAARVKYIQNSDSVPGKDWKHQLCRKGLGTGNNLQIPWQPYHHHSGTEEDVEARCSC